MSIRTTAVIVVLLVANFGIESSLSTAQNDNQTCSTDGACSDLRKDKDTIKMVEVLEDGGWSMYKFYVDEEGNPVRHGQYEEYYASGDLKSQCTYVNGVIDGLLRSYYENGLPSRVTAFVKGKHHGDYHRWHANGRLAHRWHFQHGQKLGKWSWYHQNGQKSLEGWMRQNDESSGKDGAWLYWDERGRLRKIMEHRFGTLDGLFVEYDKDGQLLVEKRFRADKLHGRYREWHENGEMKVDGSYKHSIKTGKWIGYDANGELEYQGEYDDRGRRHGHWMIREKGETREVEYNHGELTK